MNHTITDVIIHTNDRLSDIQLAEVTRRLSVEDGIISFNRNQRTPHCLMVAYNASRIRARHILDTVIGMGHRAQLVGM